MFTTTRIVILAVLIAAPTALAQSERPAAPAGTENRIVFAAECMRPDRDVITLLERLGEAQEMPGQEIFERFMTVTRARASCREGHVAEGLALYNGILQPITVGSAAANDKPAAR